VFKCGGRKNHEKIPHKRWLKNGPVLVNREIDLYRAVPPLARVPSSKT